MVSYYIKDKGWYFDHEGLSFGPYASKETAEASYKNMYRGCDSCED